MFRLKDVGPTVGGAWMSSGGVIAGALVILALDNGGRSGVCRCRQLCAKRYGWRSDYLKDTFALSDLSSVRSSRPRPSSRRPCTVDAPMMGGSGHGCLESARLHGGRAGLAGSLILPQLVLGNHGNRTETCVRMRPGWQVDLVRRRRPVRRLEVAILRQTQTCEECLLANDQHSRQAVSVDPAVSSGRNGAMIDMPAELPRLLQR